MAPDDLLAELADGLRAILATELRLPEAEVELDRPFAEMGLNSVMAMSIRREAEQLVGHRAVGDDALEPPDDRHIGDLPRQKARTQEDSDDDSRRDATTRRAACWMTLFDSVESAPAGSESGI